VVHCVYEMTQEALNGFAPNSHGRRVWSLARTSLKVKAKGQGHQGQKTAFLVLSAACVQFVFGKASLASSFDFCCVSCCMMYPLLSLQTVLNYKVFFTIIQKRSVKQKLVSIKTVK